MTRDEFFAEIAELITDEWRKDALCKEAWPELFMQPEYEDFAKSICADCPVRLECLDTAIRKKDQYVRGGFTEKERVKLINHQRRYNQYFEYDVNAKPQMQTL